MGGPHLPIQRNQTEENQVKEIRYGTVSDTGAERADAADEPAAEHEKPAGEELAAHRGRHRQQPQPAAPLPDVREHHQPRTAARQLRRGIGAVLLHEMRRIGLGTVERGRIGTRLHSALREQELPHRPEGSHAHHRLQGHDRPRTPQRPDQGHQRPSSP